MNSRNHEPNTSASSVIVLHQPLEAVNPGLNNPEDSCGLNPDSPEWEVYLVLAKHQRVMTEWDLRKTTVAVQAWATVLNHRFNLQITELVVCVDKKFRFLGAIRFRPGINGMGLRGEVQVNANRLDKISPWQVLVQLLHALLGAWQQEHGKPGKEGYFNAEFRQKARGCGLNVEEDGTTILDADGPFAELLRRAQVQLPDPADLSTPVEKPPGDSKLKKWFCRCKPPVNVRVAVADFQAMCLKCRTRFVRQGDKHDPAGKDPQWATWMACAETLFLMLADGLGPAGNKILAIKMFRELTGLGLKETKELIEEGFARGAARDRDSAYEGRDDPTLLV